MVEIACIGKSGKRDNISSLYNMQLTLGLAQLPPVPNPNPVSPMWVIQFKVLPFHVGEDTARTW